MKNINPNSSVFLLIYVALWGISCQPANDINIDGYWIGEDKAIMINSSTEHYQIKEEDGEFFYLAREEGLIEIASPSEITIHAADGTTTAYRKSDGETGLQVWAISAGMSREFIRENFAAPDTIIISPAGAEKWFYANYCKPAIIAKLSLVRLSILS